jgi:hypothetical protein
VLSGGDCEVDVPLVENEPVDPPKSPNEPANTEPVREPAGQLVSEPGVKRVGIKKHSRAPKQIVVGLEELGALAEGILTGEKQPSPIPPVSETRYPEPGPDEVTDEPNDQDEELIQLRVELEEAQTRTREQEQRVDKLVEELEQIRRDQAQPDRVPAEMSVAKTRFNMADAEWSEPELQANGDRTVSGSYAKSEVMDDQLARDHREMLDCLMRFLGQGT